MPSRRNRVIDPAAVLRGAAAVSTGVAFLRRRRQLDPAVLLSHAGLDPAPVNVNLGSSLVVAPGWVNVDGSVIVLLNHWPPPVLKALARYSDAARQLGNDQFVSVLRDNVFVHHDLGYGAPFVDGSVDVVLASHLLEHLSRSGARRLLADCHRILRPGGIVRFAVPDATPALEAIREGRVQDGLEWLFPDELRHEADYHHFAYNEAILGEALREAGFEDVVRRDAGEGNAPDLDVLDSRPEGTLFMEARRPNL